MERNSMLVMPDEFFLMNEEEKMELEGGAEWIYDHSLTKEDCEGIALQMAYGAALATAVAVVCSATIAGKFMAAIAAGMSIAAADFALAAHNSQGMDIYYREKTVGTVNPTTVKEYKWVAV